MHHEYFHFVKLLLLLLLYNFWIYFGVFPKQSLNSSKTLTVLLFRAKTELVSC